MKTSIKILSTICAVVISLNTNAQHRTRGNETQPPKQTNTNKGNQKIYASAGYNSWGPWGGSVSIHVGNYPNYGGGYYGNGYGNYNHIKKAARNSIRQSAHTIGQALQFSDWNDMYSPWLAKAIRHQQYAKQLYFWGDYAGALNHSERAGFLAWNTLCYFNNSYGYDDGFAGNNYPNPYSDPNNPYYRQANPSGSNNNSSDEGPGYRKKGDDTKPVESTNENPNGERKMAKTELDGSLPQSKLNDRELLKMNVKDLDVE